MAVKNMNTGRAIRTGTQFHDNNDADHAKKSLDKALKDDQITADDMRFIQGYILERKHNRNLAVSTQNKILFSILAWRRESPPFKELTIGDVYSSLEVLKEKYEKNTIHSMFGIIRPFLLWLIEEDFNTTLNEKKLRAIKRPSPETMTKKAGDMLTKDDLERLITACVSSRDRALVMVLYEGGLRAAELGGLQWDDVKFDSKGVVINTRGKTMKPRYIRLTMAREHLAAWKADYPAIPEAGTPVFVTNRKRQMTYEGIRKQLQYLADRAEIRRKITPHLFRHSRITHLIQQGVSESVIKLMMWGSVRTDMFEVYAHLTGVDIDRAMLELNGIKEAEDTKVDRLEPRQCENCRTICGPTTNYCPTCGFSLTAEAEIQKETLNDQILQIVVSDPDVAKEFIAFKQWKESQKAQ